MRRSSSPHASWLSSGLEVRMIFANIGHRPSRNMKYRPFPAPSTASCVQLLILKMFIVTACARAYNLGSLAPVSGMMGDPMCGAGRTRKCAPGERDFSRNFLSFWNGVPGRANTFKMCSPLTKRSFRRTIFAIPKRVKKVSPVGRPKMRQAVNGFWCSSLCILWRKYF